MSSLIKRLPKVTGSYQEDVLLKDLVWFRVGGKAAVLFKPLHKEDLAFFIQNCPIDISYYVLGMGSNLLIRDGGFPGVVIRLMRGFSNVEFQDNRLICGAGALDRTVSMMAAERGLSGLEFLVGVPGTIGGAVYMNAGAYGQETKDVLENATVVLPSGDMVVLSKKDLGFSYRNSALPEGAIVVEATFCLKSDSPATIHERMAKIMRDREDAQPVKARTGGSTFKNPEGKKAWELIDQCGLRGYRLGGAVISEKHCNFLINEGAATSYDLEGLGEYVRETVYNKTGVTLEWEIKRIGDVGEMGETIKQSRAGV